MVYLIDESQFLPQVRGLLAVVADSCLLVHHRQQAEGGIPLF